MQRDKVINSISTGLLAFVVSLVDGLKRKDGGWVWVWGKEPDAKAML